MPTFATASVTTLFLCFFNSFDYLCKKSKFNENTGIYINIDFFFYFSHGFRYVESSILERFRKRECKYIPKTTHKKPDTYWQNNIMIRNDEHIETQTEWQSNSIGTLCGAILSMDQSVIIIMASNESNKNSTLMSNVHMGQTAVLYCIYKLRVLKIAKRNKIEEREKEKKTTSNAVGFLCWCFSATDDNTVIVTILFMIIVSLSFAFCVRQTEWHIAFVYRTICLTFAVVQHAHKIISINCNCLNYHWVHWSTQEGLRTGHLLVRVLNPGFY